MLKARLLALCSACALPLALASCQRKMDTDAFFPETISDLDEKAQDYRYLIENCDPDYTDILKANEDQTSFFSSCGDTEKKAANCLLSIAPVVAHAKQKSDYFERSVSPYAIFTLIPSRYHIFLFFEIVDDKTLIDLYISNITANHWAICYRKCIYSITREEYERVASTIDSIFESFNISASDDAAKQDGRWSTSDQSEFQRKGALPC